MEFDNTKVKQEKKDIEKQIAKDKSNNKDYFLQDNKIENRPAFGGSSTNVKGIGIIYLY